MKETLVRLGKCNHCGKCCLRSGGLMVENPMIELTEDRCKFYVDKLNNQKYGHCLVFGRGKQSIEKVKDRNGNTLTSEQIRWFNDNCVDYPSLKDAKKGNNLLPECRFSFGVIINE